MMMAVLVELLVELLVVVVAVMTMLDGDGVGGAGDDVDDVLWLQVLMEGTRAKGVEYVGRDGAKATVECSDGGEVRAEGAEAPSNLEIRRGA
jgi:hypothetical protein